MTSALRTTAGDAAVCPATAGEADVGPAELGWGLSMVMRAFSQWGSASVSNLPGGPRGHLVLATISRGRPPSQLALANELGVDRTVMTYLLDELEEAGLVERRRDPADRRARQIRITAAGSTALATFSERLLEVENRLLAPLAPDEAAAFRSMLERVARAAQGAAPTADPCGGAALPPPCPGT